MGFLFGKVFLHDWCDQEQWQDSEDSHSLSEDMYGAFRVQGNWNEDKLVQYAIRRSLMSSMNQYSIMNDRKGVDGLPTEA